MAKITLRNPDQQGIYHCWHYCRGCGQTWTHSPEDWEDMKEHIKHKHAGDWSLISTAPTDYLVAEVTIQGEGDPQHP